LFFCPTSQEGDCDFYEWQPVYAARKEVTAAIAAHAAPVQGAAAATVQPAPPAVDDDKPHPTWSHDSTPRNQDAVAPAGSYAVHLPLANIMLGVANLMVSVLVLAVLLAVMVKLYFE
jgi:hypothetical protein